MRLNLNHIRLIAHISLQIKQFFLQNILKNVTIYHLPLADFFKPYRNRGHVRG